MLHLSICSFGDQSSQLILCLERIYIFLDLDCPASVWLSSLGLRPRLDNCQTLAGSPDLGKWKFPLGKSISSFRFSTSEQLLSSSMELLFFSKMPKKTNQLTLESGSQAPGKNCQNKLVRLWKCRAQEYVKRKLETFMKIHQNPIRESLVKPRPAH